MRAAWYERTGPAAEVLAVGDMPAPEPGAGELRVRIHVSGVNPADLNVRSAAEWPMPDHARLVPHSDGAGIVDRVGEGVSASRLGERVWVYEAFWPSPFGTAAEYCVVPAHRAVPLGQADFTAGAGIGIPAMTAHRCLFADGPIEGRTVLVTGAAGAVGFYAVQLARIAGARVLATVSTAEKAATARRAGAHEVIDYRAEDVAARVFEQTGGDGVDRIVEVEFGGSLPVSEKVLKVGGVIAAYASARVREPAVPYYPLMYKDATLRFVSVFDCRSRQSIRRLRILPPTSPPIDSSTTSPPGSRSIGSRKPMSCSKAAGRWARWSSRSDEGGRRSTGGAIRPFPLVSRAMPPADHPRSYYVTTATDLAPRPALQGSLDCDVCVVGAGFTGLSAALHLAERGYSVIVLEAKRIAWGASGRNGGQLNTGLRKGPAELVARYGRDEAKRLFDMAEEAKALVHARIARHRIDCDLKPGVLLAALKTRDLAWMREEVDLAQGVFGYDKLTLLDRDQTRAEVASERYCAGILDKGAAHLHPLNYALGLARAAESAGTRIFEASPVVAIARGPAPKLTTSQGWVTARFAVLAGNAYLGRLEPRIAGTIMPINNYVIATEPLGETRAKALIPNDVAVHDTKFVVDYYRLSADRRLLFGGGETYSRHDPRDIAGFVRRYVLRVFPQLADARIDYAWGGQLAITLSRLPHIGRLEPNLYFAHGFSGQGLALTGLAGKLIAEAIAGQAERFDVFAGIAHRQFPGGILLRRPAQLLGMLWYSLRDKL